MPLVAVLVALLAGAGLEGCGQLKQLKPGRAKYKPQAVTRVLNVQVADLTPAIAARIEAAERPEWVTPDNWKEVKNLYAQFGNAPLWLEEGGVKDRVKALLAALDEAPDHALDTAGYPIDEIRRAASPTRITDSTSARAIADADVLLTAAYVAYAADMLRGQVDPKTVSQAWHIGRSKTELDSALVRSLQDSDMTLSLRDMAPQDQDYAALKVAYARYREIAAKGGWPTIPASGGAARMAALHARLEAELAADSIGFVPAPGDSSAAPPPASQVAMPGDAAAPAAPRTTPEGMRQALRGFQERHGLERTGVFDKRTIAALNTSAEARARQIAVNLERHRWLPRSLGQRYVYVNVPSFRLDAYDSGRKTLSMKVVVGAEYEGRVTPVFADSMESVVFRPYWNVTPDIQRREIEPMERRSPGYMAANNMEYFRDGGERRIRQRPGDKNSLGLVKFLFPNSFNIYLHDTPAKALFSQADRAKSHGCIRLEQPARMAEWVLGWSADSVQRAMHEGRDDKWVRVRNKIPVYIVYFTSYVRDGRIHFTDDVYNRDGVLMQKVASRGAARAGGSAARIIQAGAPASAPAR